MNTPSENPVKIKTASNMVLSGDVLEEGFAGGGGIHGK